MYVYEYRNDIWGPPAGARCCRIFRALFFFYVLLKLENTTESAKKIYIFFFANTKSK